MQKNTNSQSKYNDILIENLDRYNELEKNYKSDQKALENLKKDLENYIMIYYMYIEDDSNFIMPSDEDKKIQKNLIKANMQKILISLIQILFSQIF